MPVQRPPEADRPTADTAQRSRRRPAVLAGALAVLALVAGVVWWTTDDGSAGGGSVGMGEAPAGVGGIGSAPSGGPSPGAGPLVGPPGEGGGGVAGPGGGPSGSAAPGGPPTAAQTTAPIPIGPRLLATYVILPGLLSDQMDITITNSGDRSGEWGAVVVSFSGVNLIIVPGPGVSYESREGLHTFTPQASLRTVPAGSSVSFYFTTTVGGVLGDLSRCSLDGQACKG
jgi:hypothetical protein